MCCKDRASYYSGRDVQGASGGDGQDDNPFDWDAVCRNIEEGLAKDDFKRGQQYEIMLVPNIVNITYGREVWDTSLTKKFLRRRSLILAPLKLDKR